MAGQKQIPVSAAGCYVPGGRYSHVASAIMTITTAKVAGVPHITACSPPRPGIGIPPAILYAMDLCGADVILNMGGVQGVAAMANGLFGLPKADILVGPGNQYVAEAKRILYGQVGIDMFAGPTDSMVIADGSADAELVACGPRRAGRAWLQLARLAGDDGPGAGRPGDGPCARPDRRRCPTLNRDSARAAWADFAEVILCDRAEEMAAVADGYAPEHLHVQARRPRLVAGAASFLWFAVSGRRDDRGVRRQDAPGRTMCCRHRARRAIPAGLSVHKFMKTVTWQRATRAASRPLAEATARISRLEGMEGHARSADVRLAKFFPGDVFDLTAADHS